MDKAWALIIDTLIGILIIFLSVAVYFYIRTETVKKSLAREAVRDFLSSAKREGCISQDSYLELIDRLSLTNEIYHIELEHVYDIAEPEYRFRTLEEVLEAQNAAYTGKNEYHYREVITTSPEVDDPVYPGELNTETNESVLESAENTPADPGHVHTDDCYHGTKHIHTGSPSSGGGCYRGQSSYYTCGASFSSGTNGHYEGTYTCSNCGSTASFSYNYLYLTCGNGHGTTYTYSYVASCSNCKTSYNPPNGTPPSFCGYTYYSYTLNCGKTEGAYYDSNGNRVFPICNQMVINITATHPVQTVATGDALITTVRAKYLDGSTKVVLGTSGFSTANPCQNQIATISYTYTLDGETHSLTCTINVTVVPRSKTCSRGHIYNLKSDGSDPGCPYCKAWVDNIRVIYPEEPKLTITIGTSLQDNGVKILVTYMDGHTEIITSGYDDNLDSSYLGTKPVTIGYKGAVTYLTVTTVCAKTVCEICGREYSLYPDGSDPGCPYCILKTPIFTGNVLCYEEKVYTDTILDKMSFQSCYRMQTGDRLAVVIKNKSSSIAHKLLQRIFPSISGNRLFYKECEIIGVK